MVLMCAVVLTCSSNAAPASPIEHETAQPRKESTSWKGSKLRDCVAPALGAMSEGDTGLSGCAMAAMAGRAADGRTTRLHGDLHIFR